MNYVTDKDLFARLDALLQKGEHKLDDFGGWRGTGTAGLVLEELLGFDPTNKDGPDSGIWEVKFHSGKSPLTLFHKTPRPDGVMRLLLNEFGWIGKSGRLSFRHTIWGQTPRGFKVAAVADRIEVQHEDAEFAMPFWTVDTILAAFGYKLRRLIVVHGSVSKSKGTVTFHRAQLHRDPQITNFIKAILTGKVAIDFDFRATDTTALRDHGTKFRINIENLDLIYNKSVLFERRSTG